MKTLLLLLILLFQLHFVSRRINLAIPNLLEQIQPRVPIDATKNPIYIMRVSGQSDGQLPQFSVICQRLLTDALGILFWRSARES